MNDRYLNSKHVGDRLHAEYNQHKKLIIACDFDETLYDFHKRGDKYPKLTELLKRCNQAGFYVVIFTANADHDLVRRHCEEVGVEIFGINESVLRECDSGFPETRKIYYNAFLDDRAGLDSVYDSLSELLDMIGYPSKSEWYDQNRRTVLDFVGMCGDDGDAMYVGRDKNSKVVRATIKGLGNLDAPTSIMPDRASLEKLEVLNGTRTKFEFTKKELEDERN